MSKYNPETFLSQETSDVMETKFTPLPSGEYKGVVKSVDYKELGADNSPMLEVVYRIIDQDALAEQLNMNELSVRQSIWLDLNESGGFDTGPNKNVKLGKLREALGQLQPGVAWSPMQMVDQGPVLIQVGMREDKNDPDVVYNDVKRVTTAH